MERLPSVEEEAEQQKQQRGLFSCWGKLRLAALWRRLRRCGSIRRRRGRLYVRRGSFKYDPLSYAQNFDEGGQDNDDEEAATYHRVFSSRFAALHPPPPPPSAACA
ncbi:hypothetical protein Cni_G08902 [Canna indica]|uniref:Uncharacterized protein n=1 Tax=Canna indica TaxID=4628 RepID=A0AAQ3K1D9_9LILI|nr:hypothetical protein Cni_G08902 [Canna indica]